MTAAWFRMSGDARRRWRSWLALALLAGFAAGVVMASLAAAQRADSAFDRFRKWSNAADIQLFTGAAPLDVAAVRALPEVAAAVDAWFVWMVGESGESILDPVYSSGAGFTEVDRPKVLAGRRPHPDRADEAAISPVAARETGLGVGSTVTMRALAPEQLELAFSGESPEPAGPTVTLQIVGIEAIQTEFIQDLALHLTPAFGQLYGDSVATIPVLAVKLERGEADLASFTTGLQRISPGAQFDASTDVATEIRRSVHIQAVALRLFAALAALAALVIVSQALVREAFVHRSDDLVLRSLGMTHRQLLAVAALRSGAVAVAASLVAVAVAVIASPLMLFGLARDIEPSPGLSLEITTLSIGVLVLAVLTVVGGTLPAWRTIRAASDEDQSLAGKWTVGTAVRLGASPSALAGLRMALQRGAGRSAAPVRSTLVGTTLSLAALVAALTFGTSLEHLSDTPELYGWNWDAVVGSPFDNDVTDRVVPALSASPAVGEFSSVNFAELQMQGVRTRAFGFDTVRGGVLPPVIEGREPRAPDEIVIGTKSLRATGRSVGQVVNVEAGDRAVPLTIVGRGVIPAMGESDEGGLGEGAFLTSEGLRRLVPEAPTNLFTVRYSAGVDAGPDALSEFEDFGVQTAEPPIGIADLARIDDLPGILAGLLVLLAAGTLSHTLITTVRQRRRDLAILKTLGFERRQVWTTVAWQATALVLTALVVAVPSGIAGGRWLWTLFAEDLGIVPAPVVPVIAVLVLVPAGLVVTNIIAALPGRSAAATRPALVLRSE